LAVGPNDVFAVRETHGRALRTENHLIAHSPDFGWCSLYAAIFEEAPLQTTESTVRDPFLIYHLARPTEVTRKIAGSARERSLIGPRGITITPGSATTQWQHSGRPEILQVYLRHSTYSTVVSEMYGCETAGAQILPRLGVQDPMLEQLCLAIAKALRDGRVREGLYTDTLAQMIAVHLAAHHSSRSQSARLPSTDAIAGWKMRRLMDYIEENLDRDLTLKTMAAEVSLNSLYLPRVFKKALGQTPHQYVLRRRVERARQLLSNTDMPIVDVALATGFSSQSHLSNWFLRLIGVSPAAFRCHHSSSLRP
jgi:AraC family transcriptional regulator